MRISIGLNGETAQPYRGNRSDIEFYFSHWYDKPKDLAVELDNITILKANVYVDVKSNEVECQSSPIKSAEIFFKGSTQ